MTTQSRPSHPAINQEGSRFRETHVSGGTLLQGNFAVTINPAAPARANYVGPYSLRTLFKPVKTYVRRPQCEQIQKQLLDATVENGEHGRKVLIVWGLGGAGKTQIVLDYVHTHRTEYTAFFWIEASQKVTIERDYMNIYRSLFDGQLPVGQDFVTIDDAVLRVKNWFCEQRDRWLLVFDGADSIDNEEDHNYVDLNYFMPNSTTGHIIVTTRSDTALGMTILEGVEVGQLDEPQAIDLFYQCSGVRKHDPEIEDGVRQIVQELGCLALAVNLAGTYVAETPRLRANVKGYLSEYIQRRQELLNRKPRKLIHQYSESVLTTWETSFRAIQAELSEAAKLLSILAFLSFDDIFMDLFGLTPETPEVGPDFRPGPDLSWRSVLFPEKKPDFYILEDCFRILRRYSFVEWKSDQDSYSMHKLVHAWSHDRLSQEEQFTYGVGTLDLVWEATFNCRTEPGDKARLVPHVMANFATAVQAAERSGRMTNSARKQLSRIGVFVWETGRWSETFAVEKFLVGSWRRDCGEEHPSTITAMNNLANTLGKQGKLDEAGVMMKEVLEKMRHILGEDHPSTISAMNNLAVTLSHQGKLDEAGVMMKEVLEKRRHTLGEDHPDTISAMNNLTNTLGNQGKLDEAGVMMKEVLEKMRHILGEDHPDTISAMGNLAKTLSHQGKLDEAGVMMKEVLEKRRHILGEDHPSTISAMGNLAITLSDQGKLDEAGIMEKEVMEKMRHILGEDHPSTIGAMHNLAKTLGDQDKLDEAGVMKKEVLEKMRHILGEDHPDTISAMNNLAKTLSDQGKLDEAGVMKKEVLEKRRHILGEDHPDTISAMNNLAVTLSHQGKLDEAEVMMKEVLEKRRHILGEDHPDTITAMNNLAITLHNQGKSEEAGMMMKEVLEKMRRILGEDHPSTITTMNNLAITLRAQGKSEEAGMIMEEVLEKMIRILGSTISDMSNLANTLSDQDKLDEAGTTTKEAQ